MRKCQRCGAKEYSVGYWHYGAFIKISGDQFDNAPAAHQRAAQRNRENPAEWVAVLIADNGLCQRCNYHDLARHSHVIEPVIEAEQLPLFTEE